MQGYRHDLRLLISCVKMLFPYTMVLAASSNQVIVYVPVLVAALRLWMPPPPFSQTSYTEGDILHMGQRLADEVDAFIQEKVVTEDLELQGLSFVGFSLGCVRRCHHRLCCTHCVSCSLRYGLAHRRGVMIRAALRQRALAPYIPFFRLFMTIASPHLGLMYSQSALFSTGVFVMRKWKKHMSLSQLSYTDSPTLAGCMLYRLAVGCDGPTDIARRVSITSAGIAAATDAGSGAASTDSVSSASTGALSGLATKAYLMDDSTHGMVAGTHAFGEGKGGGPDDGYYADSLGSSEPSRSPAVGVDENESPGDNFWQDWVTNGGLLKLFERVVLVGSLQDGYTPHHSCRGESCASHARDSSPQGEVYGTMLQGFWSEVSPKNVTKIEVSFPVSPLGERERGWGRGHTTLCEPCVVCVVSCGRCCAQGIGSKISVNSMLGREAHLAFLDSQHLAVMFGVHFTQLFE